MSEIEDKIKELCPHCKAGEPVRRRSDTGEWVHDFSFGAVDPKTGQKTGRGHCICSAHSFRVENGQ